MLKRLSQEEIMTIHVLNEKGQNNCEIAKTLGVTEGAVRYHRKRRESGEDQRDRRKDRSFKAAEFADTIAAWMAERAGEDRPANIKALHDWLVENNDYPYNYRSVLRFVRNRYPKPKRRPYRRVETPPGVQAQVDWLEYRRVDIGEGLETLYGFVMVLSHSRAPALIWSRKTDQLAWQNGHNEAFRRLGGVPAVVRIDNLKTGIKSGAGAWAVLNDTYRSYAKAIGFHVDPCPVRYPEAKGKVESRIGKIKTIIDPRSRRFESLEELQEWTDEVLTKRAETHRCPATGTSVREAWRAEQPLLRPICILPEAYDIAVSRPVHKDCTVNFENHSYSVPFTLAWRRVEVRGCSETVQILHEGRVRAVHRRHTEELNVIDPSHFEGAATNDILPPLPLGKMAKRIMQLAKEPVQYRAIDYYEKLAEVAR